MRADAVFAGLVDIPNAVNKNIIEEIKPNKHMLKTA